MEVGGDEAEEVLQGTELASDVTANNSQYSAILLGSFAFKSESWKYTGEKNFPLLLLRLACRRWSPRLLYSQIMAA